MQTAAPAGALLTPRAEIAPAGSGVAIGDRYTFDVRLVDEPPSPVFLLARFSEPPGDSCEERLTAHARGLGANRLYIHRGSACTGSAFFVRTVPPLANRESGESPADASGTRRWAPGCALVGVVRRRCPSKSHVDFASWSNSPCHRCGEYGE